jgi:MYXO-CTERM domain-containing protein
MWNTRLLGPAVIAAALLSWAAPRDAGAATRSYNQLTTGNGHGFQVWDAQAKKITTFLEHPYRYLRPGANPQGEGVSRRNLAFDFYFGIKAPGGEGWLTAGTAGDPEYTDQSNIVHAPITYAGVTADTYAFAPFGYEGNAMIALLHAPGATDGFALFNFHMGGAPGDLTPAANGESLRASGTDAIVETGPGGGAMVYVALTGTDHRDCATPFAKVTGGQDLGDQPACAGDDQVTAFQKKLGADGWLGVAVQYVDDATQADATAQALRAWASGRPADVILKDARAEWGAWRKPPPDGVACTDDETKLWRQSESVLRMAQVREPNTASRKSHGMIVAALPLGEWHTGWVRDGNYATVALARMGHVAEAKMSLDFFLNAAPVAKYTSYVSNVDYRVSVCRYFGSGEEEADYSGQASPNVEMDGWGMVMWSARQYVEASGDAAWLSAATGLGPTAYQAIQSGVAAALETNLEASGIVKAESGPWEVHDQNKRHFAYTTLAAARGFCDMATLAQKSGDAANVQKYQALAAKVKAGLLGAITDQNGAIGGSVEGIRANKYTDGAPAEAFGWNVLDDWKGTNAVATLKLFDTLEVATGGLKRNDDALSTYDDQEWAFIDLRVSGALRRGGRTADADALVALVVQRAAPNFYLIPELYDALAQGAALGQYTGAVPMVGFGAGAYAMTMLDRAGLIEPNDCADGKGHTLPRVTCNGPATDAGPPADADAADAASVAPPSGDGGGLGDAGVPNGVQPTPGSAGGCSCRTTAARADASWGFGLWGIALVLGVARRRR